MSTTNILDLNNRIDELEKNSGGGGSADSAKRSDIATEFSTETSYTAGNFVYYEGKLYQFNADHSAGAWDPTDVVEANVTDQIVSNASAIAGLTASDVAYDNTNSGLTATDVQGAVDELEEKMCNVRMTKLWENPDPTNTFAAQNITLSSSDYDFLLVVANVSAAGRKTTAIFPKGNAGIIYTTGGTNNYRTIDYVSDGTKYDFGDSQTVPTYGSGTRTTDNTMCIPVVIYGIKLT